MKEITAATFEKEVLNSPIPVLVDFYAPWCGPCKMLAPMLEQWAKPYDGKISFVKLDIDQAQEITAQFHIQGVPTLILFSKGAPVGQKVGVPQQRELRALLDENTK